MLKRCVGRALARAQQAEYDGRLPEALRAAEAILADHPQHSEARLIRARIWARTGHMSCAQEELRELLTHNDNHLEARLALAAVLLLTGGYGEAVDHLAAAARQCGTEYGTEIDIDDETVEAHTPAPEWSRDYGFPLFPQIEMRPGTAPRTARWRKE